MVKRHTKRRKPSAPQQILQKLSLRDRVVYSLLTDVRYSCTQATVSKDLNLAKSTVCDITNRLIAAKAIYKHGDDRQNIIYRKGINHRIVDEYLKTDIESGEYRKFINYQVVADRIPKEPHNPLWRMHLGNGGWIDLTVDTEGSIDTFVHNEQTMTLFGNTPPNKGMRGLLKWDGKIFTNLGWFPIRYIKGINTETKTFGISPKGILINGKDANISREQVLELFYRIITPIFNSMEKYGGWIFKKDPDGNYEFRSKASPEFGADAYVTKIMTDLRGECFGIPGMTRDWHDHSENAGDPGEYETADPELVEAITSLPHTHSMVNTHEGKLSEISYRVEVLEHRVNKIEESKNEEEQ